MTAAAVRHETVERLRGEIRKLQAAPRQYVASLRTGISAVDALWGNGIPLGRVVELCGDAASGRVRLALRVMAAATREQRLCAYVDGPGELYPPAAAASGVDFRRLLVVRPPAPRQLVWSAVQLLRSGAFACVTLDLTHTGVRLGLAEVRKLQDAAEKGGAVLVLLTPTEAAGHAAVRFEVEAAATSNGDDALRLRLVRQRAGAATGDVEVRAQELFGQEPPPYRYRAACRGPGGVALRRQLALLGEAPTSSLAPEVTERFKRPKTTLLRDGPGLLGTRPGRDVPLRLSESMGVHREHA